MFKFIINVVLIILVLGVFVSFSIDIDRDSYEVYNKLKFRIVPKSALCIIPLVILIGYNMLGIVPANTVGVRYSPFKGTSENTLQEGLHIISPFDTIYEIDTTIQERTQKDVAIQTKDAQVVKVELNIKYQVSKDNAFKVYKGYKTLKNLNDNIIANFSQASLSEVCTQFNVIDILGESRNEVVVKAAELLKVNLAEEGVTLKALSIKDINAGDAIEKAIQEEAVAKKSVETAKQKQEKAKTDADTKLIQAEGEAKSNAVKTKELTDKILMEQWINKWDGKMPYVAGENGVMLDINELIKSE